MAFSPRVGVYICYCGINIAATVDVEEVAEFASHLPGVVVARAYTYMCSEPGQGLIMNDITEQNLNRVVVASCSPRMHEPTFRATIANVGLNPYFFEMANIREQCSWVHPGGASTTIKAKELVASAVAKANLLEPLEIRYVPVTPSGVVVGGGMAGMQAALDIADAGYSVTVVEKSDSLGGYVAQLCRVFPTLELAPDLANSLIERVTNHPQITVMTNAEVNQVGGYVGNFEVQVRRGEELVTVPAGAIIVATGYEPFNPNKKPELGYGVYPQVITTLDFEKLASKDFNFNGNEPKRVVFIQCVGSRDQEVGNPYCSARCCCMVTAKQARLVPRAFS